MVTNSNTNTLEPIPSFAKVNKRGRQAYNLHGFTCLPSGIVMEIHDCHITRVFEAAVRLGSHLVGQGNSLMIFQCISIRVCYQNKFPNFYCNMIDLCYT